MCEYLRVILGSPLPVKSVLRGIENSKVGGDRGREGEALSRSGGFPSGAAGSGSRQTLKYSGSLPSRHLMLQPMLAV